MKDNKTNHENSLAVVEYIFYFSYYSGKYYDARNILLHLLPDDKGDARTYRVGKYIFLISATYFMERDFTTALRMLRMINSIDDDKAGWKVNISLLTIMCLIELKRFEEATHLINALPDLINDLDKGHNIERIKSFYVLLNSTAAAHYDFKTTYQNNKGYVESLEAGAALLKWLPRSPEMVILDQWFIAKVFKRDFIQIIPGSKKAEIKMKVISGQ